MAVTINVLTILQLHLLRRIKLETEHVFPEILLLTAYLLVVFVCLDILFLHGHPWDKVTHAHHRHTIWETKICDDLHGVIIKQELLLLEVTG